jgi:hypothetical protein
MYRPSVRIQFQLVGPAGNLRRARRSDAHAGRGLVARVRLPGARALGGIVWRHDSRELYFLSLEAPSIMAVDITTAPALSAGTPRRLFELPGPFPASAQVSSIGTIDGERWVFPVAAAESGNP